jgi:alpha-tubulin suppressor-like RCC1 family protein
MKLTLPTLGRLGLGLLLTSVGSVGYGLAACNGSPAPVASGSGGGADAGLGTVEDAASDATSGTPVQATFSTTAMDFGLSDCGGTAPANSTLMISNSGGGKLTWFAQLDQTTSFSIVGSSSGSFDPGGVGTITIAAKAIPTSATAGAVYSGSLLIITNDPIHSTQIIPLTITAQGATFSLTPTVADFGQSPVGTTAPEILLALTNQGNKEVSVNFTQPTNPAFSFSWLGSPNAVTLKPNASVPTAAAHFTPTSSTTFTDTIGIQVQGATCANAVTSIPLSGKGLEGVVGVSPGSISVGQVDCGSQANDQIVTITNSGTSAYNWKATLGKGASSPFSLASTSGVAATRSALQLAVFTSPIPAISPVTDNLYGDVLTITTDVIGDTPHVIPITQTARGVILTAAATSLDFKKQLVTVASAPLSASLTNNGNAIAHVTLTATNAAYQASSVGSIEPSATATSSVILTPPNFGPNPGTIAISSSDVLCAPLPAAITLAGSGTGAAKSIASGDSHTCAILQKGIVACWGTNTEGQLGNGTTSLTGQSFPTLVPGISGTTAIAAGPNHTCVITASAGIKCWGDNGSGQLGIGTYSNVSSPTDVSGITSATQISATSNKTCAVTSDGFAYCSGYSSDGSLGNNSFGETSVPVQVNGACSVVTIDGGSRVVCASALTGVTNISTAYGHTCAVAGGQVYCWGENGSGESGPVFGAQLDVSGQPYGGPYNNGGPPPYLYYALTPYLVTTVANASSVATVDSATCVAKVDGTAQCFGYSGSGQLGDGNVNPPSFGAPVVVKNLANVSSISGSNSTFCAATTSGPPDCWGNGGNATIGNGNTTNAATPVAASVTQRAIGISVGSTHTCAVLNDNTVWCWGHDESGQLGDGQTTTQNSPVEVQYF